MRDYHISKHNSFYAIGLSYKKADAEVRGKFSLDVPAIDRILGKAKEFGIDGLLAISTCNRTELYGFAQHPYQLIKLLCDETPGTVEEFQEVAYVYKNHDAISHMFKVGTGLDSQILGDFEIISQIKQGFYRSKKQDMANPFLERLCNSVIQASKRIKNETEISSGATSVAFASVKYILDNVDDISNKNILLFGTGKIGRNTCENLVKHSNNSHITLINRTRAKAEDIAGKFQLTVKDYGDLQTEIRKTDILVVATGAQLPTVSKAIIHPKKPLLVLDLSVPKNVSDDVRELDNVTLVHLDQLSQITDETLSKRKEYVPKAEAIIEKVKKDFLKWLESRKFAPVINALKDKLNTMKAEEIDFQTKKIEGFDQIQAEIISDRIIQKITKQFANHLKSNEVDTDDSLELIQKVFQLELHSK
ncbi:MAG: glutamyl-tRNA reductase [Allomuricauda sp.]|jgi:glutamyl-tRNA reductase|uniref:Glutamyl-tRNA reductase n=1 Tax=Flagellimonas sp. MMG031 TaxID=3158549 RepID=A0AAU7N092_9FLAO|nr:MULTISPECIES: glutamyl-tRNA reductase [unclassified Allomuricauda]MBO6532244.1 glutamyl-tRNA reductase [Allomuricauda sp.]MBO6588089.1 glutamyl-tRNA reductase [Allomuricauda sp.]MBO6617714.1 glutamyl-tRNA reductase [Allomuricauda sp.]MBO6643275.1 glutamyl-tRNA reductase [Allomuricauda sp.]MBO6746049.1 glutamyl-tRNA reductase [Allomuricauda sp.]